MKVDPLMKTCVELLAESSRGTTPGRQGDPARSQDILEAGGYGSLDQKSRRILGGMMGLAVHYVGRYAEQRGTTAEQVMDELLLTVATVEEEDGRGDA